jgi:hypothetical protein
MMNALLNVVRIIAELLTFLLIPAVGAAFIMGTEAVDNNAPAAFWFILTVLLAGLWLLCGGIAHRIFFAST